MSVVHKYNYFHLDVYNACFFFKVNILDVSTIFLNERSDPRLHDFLYNLDCLTIIVINFHLVIFYFLSEQGLTPSVMLSNY